MGHCRGGLTKKIHALVDAERRPIRFKLTLGQAGGAPVGTELVPDSAPGAPLIADRANDTKISPDPIAGSDTDAATTGSSVSALPPGNSCSAVAVRVKHDVSLIALMNVKKMRTARDVRDGD